tara:strand:- start:259 stop:444 length:186 start_codon:yes stop_codon:yes gene_type:complete
MTTYYVTTKESFYRDYKVEAKSKEEAEKMVLNGDVDHFLQDHGGDTEIVPTSTLTEEEELS